jgi:hypothetical protein
MDGLRDFYQMRRQIKEDRNKMIYEQARARMALFENIKMFSIIGVIVLVTVLVMWFTVDWVIDMGRAAGKW